MNAEYTFPLWALLWAAFGVVVLVGLLWKATKP